MAYTFGMFYISCTMFRIQSEHAILKIKKRSVLGCILSTGLGFILSADHFRLALGRVLSSDLESIILRGPRIIFVRTLFHPFSSGLGFPIHLDSCLSFRLNICILLSNLK